jgi:hypothetical protein
MRWAVCIGLVGESRCIYRVFVGRIEGKRPLGRPSYRMEDSIEMDIQEVECGPLTGLIGV